MKHDYAKDMALYVEIQKSTDKELMDLVHSWFNGKEIDIRKIEFAVRELENRGYKPAITFERG
ncbi:MAG: hypothetical protein JRE40_12185 [Deltaproteobacteria bacterium]|nr:hypothetical protein [Deltaproteobacteria bacterium]